jgi:hypothetical protein
LYAERVAECYKEAAGDWDEGIFDPERLFFPQRYVKSHRDFCKFRICGNIFVADQIDSQVQEIVAVGGNIPVNPTVKLLGSGFNRPYGVAVDGSGNVYVSDTFNFVVKEILAVDGSIPANPTINTLGSFGEPFGLAVDANGNVFVADAGFAVVSEILAVNGSIPANPTSTLWAKALAFPLVWPWTRPAMSSLPTSLPMRRRRFWRSMAASRPATPPLTSWEAGSTSHAL